MNMRKLKGYAKNPFPQPDVVTKSVPVPTEGWDAISPLANMDPKRAPILVNWTPRPGWVELRAGYELYQVGLGSGTGSPVETLMVRRSPTAQTMFAAAGGKIYDVSSLAVNSVVQSGLSNNRWQYINFTPSGGTTVIQLANGQDALRQWDGSTWTQPNITGLPGGANTSAIFSLYAQKRRIWYLLNNSTQVAFMPTDAITGPIAGSLDLGALFTKGGHLQFMADWTMDGGTGPQDYAVFGSSQGQVALYSGDDPTNANVWALVGVFNLARPIGARCATVSGSDVALITLAGLLPLSQALPYDPSADRSVSLTSRIQNAMADFTTVDANNFGWQLINFPAQTLALLNVPVTENVQQIQCVMNTLTGAWTQFNGWNANCFEIYNDQLYFGDNTGGVQLAYSGGLDGLRPISADMQCAYNWFEDPGRTKRMTMIQPLMVASGSITPFLEVDEDFGASTAAAPVSILQGGALWDTAKWDTAIWPQPTVTITNWLSAQAIGHALAVRMKVNVQGVTPPVAIGEFDFAVFDTAIFDGTFSPGAALVLQINAFNAIIEMGAYV